MQNSSPNLRRTDCISNGRYSTATKLLESDGVHPNTPEIIQTLVDKDPVAPQPHVPVPSPLFVQFEIETVLKCIESFPGGSAGGVFGYE